MRRKSLLDEKGPDRRAPFGSKQWAYTVLGDLAITVKKLDGSAETVKELIHSLEKNEVWKILGYISLEMMLQAEIDLKPELVRAFKDAEKGKTTRDIMTHIQAGKKGGRGKKASCNTTGFTRGDVPYLKARLKRDNPELYEAVQRGELSTNAAAIKAGIRKNPTPLQVALKAYNKLSDSDKAEFHRQIGAQ